MFALAVSQPTVPTIYSIGDAMQAVRAWANIAPKRQRDLVSALSRAAKVTGLQPGAVQFTPAALRASFLRQPAAALGVTDATMKNIRSHLKAAAVRLEIIDANKGSLSLTWGSLLSLLSLGKPSVLGGFARFCSARQIGPDMVDDSVIEQFQAWLTDRTFAPHPAVVTGEVRGAWNAAVRKVAGWPQRPLSRLRDRGQYILPLSAFTTTFKESLDKFAAALTPSSVELIFGREDEDESGNGSVLPRKACRPSTIRTRLDHLRWAASAVVATGVPIEEITSLEALVTPLKRARAALIFLHERAGSKRSSSVGHVAEVMRIVARHHARLPEAEIAIIRVWAKHLSPDYRFITDKNKNHIEAMLEPDREAKLYAMPQALMNAARQLRAASPRQAASLALRAVAIELLTHIPFRLANVVGLRLDQHVCRADPTRGPITRLSIKAHETKGKRPLDMPVPGHLAATLQEWIDDFRPIIGSADCRYLFPGHGTGDLPITPQGLRDAIRETMKDYIGVPLTPHQFRHLAANIFLRENPGQYELLRQLLGHADLKSIIRSYASTERTAAVNRFHDLLEERRTSLRKPGKKGKR